ncbi:MAG: DUF2520 domain-containing protein [Terriglobales bacterium]
MMGRWTILGTGRVGTALVPWLRAAGAPPAAAVGRRRLNVWLGQLPESGPAGILIAVPDDALPELARRLARARKDWRGWCVLHTSGTRTSAVLAPLARRGAAAGSLHPMMTFTRRAPSPRGVICSIEGDTAATRTARRLVRAWGGVALALDGEAKAAYHLAATLVGPGAVVEAAAAEAILREAGFSGARLRCARQGLLQLLRATAVNLERGSAAAWTGPWARGDRATIRSQRQRLSTPALRRLYDGLTAAAQAHLGQKSTTGTRKV